TDLIALMMVVVTGLSAYATWKTAQVTNEILLTSQCRYIGVESVNLVDETNPKVVVDFRNFALCVVITNVLGVNGKALSEPQHNKRRRRCSRRLCHLVSIVIWLPIPAATRCRARRVW